MERRAHVRLLMAEHNAQQAPTKNVGRRLSVKQIHSITLLACVVAAAPAGAFDQADLDRLNETGECEGCDLDGALLGGRNLVGAQLAGANISNTFIRFQNFNNADLSGVIAVDAFFFESTTMEAVFDNADLTKVGTENSTMRGASFVGATFVEGSIKSTNLRMANFSGANLTDTVFTGSTLSGATFAGAILINVVFDHTGLSDVDMTDADLTGAAFNGTDISSVIFCRTTMPDGTLNNEGCP